MKVLKILLVLVLLLAVLFFLKGIITPTVSYESTILVSKSPQESWAVMSDESKMSQWLDGFKRTELVSGTASTVGAVSNVYIDNKGQEMVMKETINKIVPDQHLDMTFTMDFMNMDYVMSLKETAEGTSITSQSTTTGNGPIARSIVSFMGKAMKAQEDTNLENLKKLIDENTANYFEEADTYKSQEIEK